jgi:ferredoxin--NADP+ reductase
VREVMLLGRRGPAQAAFTNPELLELGQLECADVVVEVSEIEVEPPNDTTRRRNVEILRDYARREPDGRPHRIAFRFLRSPIEILGDGEGRVRGLRVARNRLDDHGRVLPTGEEEVIECGLVLRSIGYRGVPLDGVPFDEHRGLIRNDGGRVCAETGDAHRGEYVVGWIKRGPSGVIGTNKKDASDTIARVLEDEAAGHLNEPADPDPEAIESWLRSEVPGLVTWSGWEAIDRHETSLGEPHGRPRVKVVSVAEMLQIAAAAETERV